MWLVSAAVLMMALQVQSEKPVVPPDVPGLSQRIDIRSDPVQRFTVPISIGGQDRRFLVDTGAEKSGISIELAHALDLRAGQLREVTGFAGSRFVPTVLLSVSGLSLGPARVLTALALSRDAIGADGFLGLDTLRGNVVLFDFAHNDMSVRRAPTAHAWMDGDEQSTVPMKFRNARMVFAGATANGVRVQAILDTGSNLSVGNDSLRAELRRRNSYSAPVPIEILSVTGERITGEYVVVPSITVGDIRIANMPIAFAGPEPFAKLGFGQRPALLLGMDILRQFDQVEIDFPKNEVRFTAKGLAAGPTIRFST